MKLKFIGTSSGQTNPKRNHSAILFENDSSKILIDCGDGVSRSLLHQKILPNQINKIIISHFHSDHIAGLPSLLTQMIISKRNTSIDIFIPKGLQITLQNFLRSNFLFIEKYDFKIDLHEFELNKECKFDKDFKFVAKQNSHISNKHNIKIKNLEFVSVSFLFKINKKNIFHTADIGSAKDLLLFNNFNVDTFICETTHLSLKEIENYIIDRKIKRTFLTHINYSDEELISDWHNNLPKNFQRQLIIAHDGLSIKI